MTFVAFSPESHAQAQRGVICDVVFLQEAMIFKAKSSEADALLATRDASACLQHGRNT